MPGKRIVEAECLLVEGYCLSCERLIAEALILSREGDNKRKVQDWGSNVGPIGAAAFHYTSSDLVILR